MTITRESKKIIKNMIKNKAQLYLFLKKFDTQWLISNNICFIIKENNNSCTSCTVFVMK